MIDQSLGKCTDVNLAPLSVNDYVSRQLCVIVYSWAECVGSESVTHPPMTVITHSNHMIVTRVASKNAENSKAW